MRCLSFSARTGGVGKRLCLRRRIEEFSKGTHRGTGTTGTFSGQGTGSILVVTSPLERGLQPQKRASCNGRANLQTLFSDSPKSRWKEAFELCGAALRVGASPA